MRLLLVSRIDNPDAIAYSRKIKAVLEGDGVVVFFDDDTAAILEESGLPLADTTADAVVVVGGGWYDSTHNTADAAPGPGDWNQPG